MRKSTRYIRDTAVFAMLGTLMFVSKIAMEGLPNIHLLGVLTVAYTLAYRWRALIPIYVYVLLNGVFSGFSMWWMPYTYIWAILWAITMLLPRKMPPRLSGAVYAVVCALHGFAYGALYAPAQALMFNLGFDGMISWIVAGIPFDIVHGISNFCVGLLIYPISRALIRLDRLGMPKKDEEDRKEATE